MMTLYIGRKASKLWQRFCSEVTTEIGLLAENWEYLLAGLICPVSICLIVTFLNAFGFVQYIHGIAARGVHYIHRPGPTL